MEKVQKVCKSIKAFGEKDDHGNVAYWINFEDGSKGIFRTPDQNLFIEGQPSIFSIKEMKHSEKAGDYAILQRYKEDYVPGKKVEKSSESLSEEDKARFNRLDACKTVSFLRQHQGISIADYLNEVEQVYDYLHFGVTDKEEETKPEENELPF
jgi:hypothetical protein